MDTPDAPATKADLAQLRDELVGRMSGIETHLLKAFYTFAESNQLRLKDAQNY